MSVEFPVPTSEVLLADLIAVAKNLSPEVRTEYGERLAAAGFAVKVTGEMPPAFDVPADLHKDFGLSEDQTIRLPQALRLLYRLAKFSASIDQSAWTLWQKLAPKSAIKREIRKEQDLLKLFGLCITGDVDVTPTELARLLGGTRQIVGCVLASLGGIGNILTETYVARLSPEVIKAQAKGVFANTEGQHWRRYKELYEKLDEDAITDDIHQSLVRQVEELAALSGRTTP